jgi:hypothetical protein
MRIQKDAIFSLRISRFYTNDTPRILMYHGVAPSSPLFLNHRHITPGVFEQRLLFIKKHFNILTIEKYFGEKFQSIKKCADHF